MSFKPLNPDARLSVPEKQRQAPTSQHDIFSSSLSDVGKQTLGNHSILEEQQDVSTEKVKFCASID